MASKGKKQAMDLIANIIGGATEQALHDKGYKEGLFGGAAKGDLNIGVILAVGEKATRMLLEAVNNIVKQLADDGSLDQANVGVIGPDGIRHPMIGDIKQFLDKPDNSFVEEEDDEL